MCDLPGCPSNSDDDPLEITDENRPVMVLETTSAGLSCLDLFAKGWTSGAQGVLSDISEKWGFEGVSRVVWCLALACATLPMPDDNPLQRADSKSIRAKLTSVAGEEVADQMTAHMVTVGDQVFGAFEEMVSIARSGDEARFHDRFDTVTDQRDMLQPLIATIMMHGGFVYMHAQRAQNISALEQLQTAVRQGVDLGKHAGQTAKEIADLTALLELPDAPEGD